MPFKDKALQQASWRRWYHGHKKQARAVIVACREEKVRWLREYKATLGCTRCSENFPACLDFHHTNPAEKESGVGAAVRAGWSLKRIKAEVAKCIVLCKNCHAKEHWKLVGAEGNDPPTLCFKGTCSAD